jgi:alginate O-acetyltransferase complex protein AlgI
MLFNSLAYAFFLPTVFLLYWALPTKLHAVRNILLLAASYLFYGWWDPRFTLLLAFSTFLDYFTALKVQGPKPQITKKAWLIFSLAANLGFLGVFKYYNFFADSLSSLLHQIGVSIPLPILSIVLPVGISFYTFHGISYVLDAYYSRIKPTKNFVQYALFVSFFPLLVAGPIERATNLLPQLAIPQKFQYSVAADGLRQILFGLFKKMVVADNCGIVANSVFDNSDSFGAIGLIIGACFFAFQIYGDFSGYSDIALGSGKLFGIQLKINFRYPYFSRDIAEFWRRWHISLSSWFRDYLYIPLGGSKGGIAKQMRNVIIIFAVSGIWHGANWTFLCWGLLNALYFIPSMLQKRNRVHLNVVAQDRFLPSPKEMLQITGTFLLTTFAWIFFRSENLTQAGQIVSDILLLKTGSLPQVPAVSWWFLPMLLIEWVQRTKDHPGDISGLPGAARWLLYLVFAFIVLLFSYQGKDLSFIYFQF